jgi:23S rRNA (cytidine1920-2'-O)/16S rRNA (cytidine1409-2'-O)-methyltransferase
MKKRVDVLLVERGLAETRSQAQALVLAGRVHGYDKPGQQVSEEVELEVQESQPYVSRGGEKLRNALDAFAMNVAGRSAADIGASTGGFTDCLLQSGAARIVAIDVGHGQLHPKIRNDPRVIVLERTNARTLTELPFDPDLVVCDVSFISATKVLWPVLALAKPGWEALVLVKPQFEAGRAEVRKGVVRDPLVQQKAIETVVEAARAWDGETVGVVDSGLPGPKGNREFFVRLINRPEPSDPDDIDRWIREAVAPSR